MEAASKLSNLQLELLKMFQYNLSERQIVEIKSMLARYFAETATKEMDNLWVNNNWDEEIMNNWVNEHLRK